MFLSNHSTFGALIAKNAPNPLVAFVLGVCSHYLLDIIPHGDSTLTDRYTIKQIIAIAILDQILLVLIFLSLFWVHPELLTLNVLAGAFGAMVPDGLQFIYYTTKHRLVRKHQRLHNTVHYFIARNYEMPFSVGVGFQLVTLVLFIYLLLL